MLLLDAYAQRFVPKHFGICDKRGGGDVHDHDHDHDHDDNGDDESSTMDSAECREMKGEKGRRDRNKVKSNFQRQIR